MKKSILSGAAVAIVGLAIGSLSAQTQSTTTSTTTNYLETSKLTGTKVRSSDGEVGTIKDVVLDNNGCMAYTVLSTEEAEAVAVEPRVQRPRKPLLFLGRFTM